MSSPANEHKLTFLKHKYSSSSDLRDWKQLSDKTKSLKLIRRIETSLLDRQHLATSRYSVAYALSKVPKIAKIQNFEPLYTQKLSFRPNQPQRPV